MVFVTLLFRVDFLSPQNWEDKYNYLVPRLISARAWVVNANWAILMTQNSDKMCASFSSCFMYNDVLHYRVFIWMRNLFAVIGFVASFVCQAFAIFKIKFYHAICIQNLLEHCFLTHPRMQCPKKKNGCEYKVLLVRRDLFVAMAPCARLQVDDSRYAPIRIAEHSAIRELLFVANCTDGRNVVANEVAHQFSVCTHLTYALD